MAQITDISETNHLSAPEDAFNQFQANIVVEEEDYITLADIVPPEPSVSVPYLSGDPNEIPYDNEVILTNLDDQFSDANSQSSQFGYDDSYPLDRQLDLSDNTGAEVNIGVKEEEDDQVVSHQRESLTANESLNTSDELVQNKRTRTSTKKLSTYDNNSLLTEISSTEIPSVSKRGRKRVPKKIPDTVTELPKPIRGRRGKSKKSAAIEEAQVSNENEVSDLNVNIDSSSQKAVTRRGRSKKNSQVDTSLEANPPGTESAAKKRGRKRKPPVDEVSNAEVKAAEQDLTTGFNEKRGRKRKPPVDEVSNAEVNAAEQDLKPVDLEDIPVHTITNFNKLTDSQVEGNIESQTNNDFDDQDDSMDGITLSNLKSSLNKTISSLDEQTEINDEVSHSEQLGVNGTDNDHSINDSELCKENGEQKESYPMDLDESLLVEDMSKRPKRRGTRQKLVYDEGSDEDPFANMELSDDDEPKKRKGKRYYSDDEYVPGKKVAKSSSDPSDSDIDLKEDWSPSKKKKLVKTGSTGRSPRKTLAKQSSDLSAEIDVTTVAPKAEINPEQIDDIEVCLQSSVIKAPNEAIKKSIWGNTFENFIANKIHTTSDLKIEKVSSDIPALKTPLEIPVLDMAKKQADTSSQTELLVKSTAVQTTSPYEIPMKDNVKLTTEQSESACQFLTSVVGTTSELGVLMTQKSEDFIKKKINTSNVTDTFKIDYCVKKSFLLLKLAKHNIIQMEEDLSMKYEDFLKKNNLLKHSEDVKIIMAKDKSQDDDSDCEIVGESVPGPSNIVRKSKPQENKSKLNPKTVFLNKELSIKIAKKDVKPTASENCKEKLNIPGSHTVWISDSVMVKKVKPRQSFLAQDSRNKKPPDSIITDKKVSDFFMNYYRDKLLSKCAQFTTTDWLQIDNHEVSCYYFDKSDTISNSSETLAINGEAFMESVENGESDTNGEGSSKAKVEYSNPDTLFSLCIKVMQKQLKLPKPDYIKETCDKASNDITDVRGASPMKDVARRDNPQTLIQLCLNTLAGKPKDTQVHGYQYINSTPDECAATKKEKTNFEVMLLKDMCSKKIINLYSSAVSYQKKVVKDINYCNSNVYGINETTDAVERSSDDLAELIDNIIEDPIYKLLEDKAFSDSLDDEIDNSIDDDIDANLTQNTQDSGTDDISCTDDDNTNISQLESGYHVTIKSLFSLCVELIRNMQKGVKAKKTSPKALKHLVYKNIKCLLYKSLDMVDKKIPEQKEKPLVLHQVKRLANICFERVAELTAAGSYDDLDCSSEPSAHTPPGLTINCVNTMTEEAFHNIQESESFQNTSQFSDDEDTNFYGEDFGQDYMTEENETEETNWLSRVQVEVTNGNQIPADDSTPSELPVGTRIKIEPLEEPTENIVDTTIVKTENTHNSLDQMTIIPESIMTKQEQHEEAHSDRYTFERQKTFDSESFEEFARSNKMMHNLDESSLDGIFSQSAFRVRRQFEPDYRHEADEFDPMSLLVPQTFEPLSIETAKGHLMQSSSDESNKEPTGKKKPERRGRKSKKLEAKTKEVPVPKEKENPTASTKELTVLTRRMREKIRQEEKKVESSDSEQELSLSRRREKHRTDSTDKNKNPQKPSECAIQVNDVDSTEPVENTGQRKVSPENEQFNGFTAVDQNEISSYQKYVKYVYDKIVPRDSPEKQTNQQIIEKAPESTNKAPVNEEGDGDDNRSESPLINYEDPVELLECEPTMPIFDDEENERVSKRKRKTETKQSKDNINIENSVKANAIEAEPTYIEKNGWYCYPIANNETKLYKLPKLILEKLPESFVQTYFRYQEIAAREKEDEDINRLINLNTLSRPAGINAKDAASRKKVRGNYTTEGDGGTEARTESPGAENYAELTPSEDEGANVEDELPPPVRVTSENILAKSSLMNEIDSDSDTLVNIKSEQNEGEVDEKRRTKYPKSKKVEVHSENVMLTADMSMNKELNLLHAPVILKHDTEDIVPISQSTKKNKSGHKSSSARDRIRYDDDSSSEEEKQWVSTKEKLLKRMGKKDALSLDDAKRTKLVTEFIERRGDEGRTRKRPVKKKRLSMRRRLEREKQLRVLSNELYDNTNLGQKKVSQSYFKGRRNIRKVLDKKSLARSTVIANMEEFERKCRLNQRLTRLREILGLEEGVNVVVINDEVCLEYDYSEQEPVVTVHPFFTKVMKAHQYEGVKFMWDACFESLEKVDNGGGGCILAHCMGLGKTLQVLALLHTVLTHPRVGMQRVLVCCPLSTVLNWVDEINKWIGPVTNLIKVFELSKLKKTYERAYQLEDWFNGGGIFIIGYELFRSMTTLDPEYDDIRPTIVNKIRTALLDPGPDIIVCDEGHLLKNDCSVLAVAMSRVKTKRRIILTGTPMQNNLREYYCMVNFVKPNLLGTYSEYSNRFENPIMNGQHRDSQEDDIKLMKQRTHILHKVLEGCLQRQEVSVLYPYLPKKHEYTVFISLTACQWDLYKHYLQNYGKQNNKQSILRDFHILQKIWSHPKVLHNFQMRARDTVQNVVKPEKLEDDLAREDLESEDIKPPTATEVWWTQYLDGGNMLDSLESSNKFVVVFQILSECISLGDKVLIFSTSLITMDVLEYFLKRINGWSLGHEYYRLDGSVPPEVRQKWCREFNAEHNLKTKLFLISTRAGSLGLNMVAANRVIILDTSWNPAHDIQSIFRVYRFGQKKDCYIYRLVAMGTMEQKIYERSVTKQAVACRVVDEQQIDRHYNMAELTELYKFDELGTSVSGGVAVGVTDVALLRVARHPALYAVHEHDSLLRGSSEQDLPDHERAAAWMQFQEEHATKQMQNQLTSSFALHIPQKIISEVCPGKTDPYDLLNLPRSSAGSLLQPSGIKTETLPQIKTETLPQTKTTTDTGKGKKGKKGKSAIKVNIPIQAELEKLPRPVNKESIALENEKVNKIVHLLIKHNVINHSAAEMKALVSNVRNIVAYGRVPEGSFKSEVTKSIADVLYEKEPRTYMPPLSNISPMTRKHSSKTYRGPQSKKVTEAGAAPEPVPSTSTQSAEVEAALYTERRKAAILAEKNMNSVLESIIDIDDDSNGGAWQGNNSDSDYAEDVAPKTHKAGTQPSKIKSEKTGTSTEPITVTSGNNNCDTITLSDDDDVPPPAKQKEKTKTQDTQKSKKDEASKDKQSEDVIPLHPSLLTNKNFIRIVAHTYLEGNPMLDDDAASMAAQYSTTKALKEFESTGKPIVSGPIYDIATKVLGKDILSTLHTTNPSIKPLKLKVEEPVQVKQEDAAPSATSSTAPSATSSAAPSTASSAAPASKTSAMPRFKAKGIEQLMKPEPKPVKKSVVPVGMYKRLVQPQTPVQQVIEAEESILPDDDDVIFNESPSTSTSKLITNKKSIPLILNSVIAKSEKTAPNILKILPGGKIVVSKSKDVMKPLPTQSAAKPTTRASNAQDTICLDSDEEETPAPVPTQPKRKMVALKSTGKLSKANPVPVSLTAANQGQPRPVSLAAANQRRPGQVSLTAAHQPEPVPVSLTAANPQVYPIPNDMTSMHPQYYAQQPMTYDQLPNNNFYMVPASQVNQLSQGGMQRVMVREQFLNPQPSGMVQTSAGNVMYSTPGGVRFMAPQYGENVMTSVPQGMMMTAPQPINTLAMPQHMNIVGNTMGSLSQTMPPAPQTLSSPAPQPATSTAAQQIKTVCKPGDILRITASGKVEILNKAPIDIPTVNETPSRPLAPKPAPACVQKESPVKPKQDISKRKERPRKISSSSSSSSDSSRASSPDNPLSILKDIVHIKSVDDILDSSSSERQPIKTANKPAPSLNKTMIARKTDLTTKTTPNKAFTSRDSSSMGKQINKTDSILKKLEDVLGPTKPTTRRPPPKPTVQETKGITYVDLDDDTPTVSKPVKEAPKPNRSLLKPKPQTSKPTPQTSKPTPQTSKLIASKLVGTSKSIIISGNGKASIDNSAKKTVRATTYEVPAPRTWTDVKKRPPPADNSAAKKRKSEPMTLKDFNIDDIDDIIELE